MRAKKRAILTVFCITLLLLAIAAGVVVYLAANIDRSGWIRQGNTYYYLNSAGKPVTGWLDLEGERYYFRDSGAMAVGWQTIEGREYCFGGTGPMLTGWVDYAGGVRWLNAAGNPVTGWQLVDGQRRLFLADGLLANGWQTIDGQRYYFTDGGTLFTGWLQTQDGSYYLTESGSVCAGLTRIDGDTYYFYPGSGLMHTGWLDIDADRYYFGSDGRMYTGWQEPDGLRCCFGDNGIMVTGWMDDGEYRYYLLPEGGVATKPTVIDGRTCYFTPDGIYVLLVNGSNPLPEGYQIDLVRYGEWARVAAIAEDHLRQMILDCRATGIECWLNSGYRTQQEQITILEERTQEYQDQGMGYDEARAKALETVAVPGYSEHQTGLAMDVVCSVTPTWLQEHCWEYGFILRYPEDKADITGIVYEHWHYRYVGTKVSMAMKDTGLCLEEYLGAA